MSATKRSTAWIAAASVGAVEALKEPLGLCRWDHAIRSAHHNGKRNVARSIGGQAKKRLESEWRESDSSAASGVLMMPSGERREESEESLRKVMYLGCWGPYN